MFACHVCCLFGLCKVLLLYFVFVVWFCVSGLLLCSFSKFLTQRGLLPKCSLLVFVFVQHFLHSMGFENRGKSSIKTLSTGMQMSKIINKKAVMVGNCHLARDGYDLGAMGAGLGLFWVRLDGFFFGFIWCYGLVLESFLGSWVGRSGSDVDFRRFLGSWA